MPSSCFPGPALPAADQIMPFPWEELGSTVWGVDFSRTVSLLGWQLHAVFPRQSLDLGKGRNKEEVGLHKTRQDVAVMGGGSGRNLSFLLFQGLQELSPNHLFEHLENKYLFPWYLSKTGTRLYYKVDLNPAILLLESKHVAAYTQQKALLFPQHTNWRVSVMYSVT